MKKMMVNGLVPVAMKSAWMPQTEILVRNLTPLIPFINTTGASLPSHES